MARKNELTFDREANAYVVDVPGDVEVQNVVVTNTSDLGDVVYVYVKSKPAPEPRVLTAVEVVR